jgi:hypothetical protein
VNRRGSGGRREGEAAARLFPLQVQLPAAPGSSQPTRASVFPAVEGHSWQGSGENTWAAQTAD